MVFSCTAVMGPLLLLCVLIHFVSSSSIARCRGYYYRPHSCLYQTRFLWYYDIDEGSCKSFSYMECIDEEIHVGYGNPLNKFDSIRECEETCYSLKSSSRSIATSSPHTPAGTGYTTEPQPLVTSPFIKGSSLVMMIPSVDTSPFDFLPPSTLMMINPTQSLAVSVFETSTDDDGFFKVSTDAVSLTTSFSPPTLTPSSSSFQSSSTPFLEISSLTSSSISQSFSVSSPSLSSSSLSSSSLSSLSSSLSPSLSSSSSSSSLSPSLSSLHTFASSSSFSTFQPDLTTSSSTSDLLNKYLFIPGSIIVATLIAITPVVFIIGVCYMYAKYRRRVVALQTARTTKSFTSDTETGTVSSRSDN